MAAPQDTTHSIKTCKYCGKEFVKPCDECELQHCKKGKRCNIGKAMNITPSKANPLIHVALCDECYESEGGVWWAKGKK